MTEDRASDPTTSPFELSLSEEGELTLRYTPDPDQGLLNGAELRAQITAGFEHVPIFDKALSEAVKRQREKKPFSLIVGGPIDASVKVLVSKDQLLAHLAIEPPLGGGRNPSAEQVRAALQSAHVISGGLEGVVEAAEAIEAEGPYCLPAARGRRACNGEDARLEALAAGTADRRPRIREDGRADYRELGNIQEVTPGMRVARLIPHTAGEAGITVTGKTLPAKGGKPLTLRPLDDTTELDASDANLLRAKASGRPVLLKDGAKVEPVLQFDNIDVGTGNVDFIGTVVVNGDVRTGMKVRSAGDIHVKGTVEAAELDAQGSIAVHGGIIGHGPVRDEAGRLRPESASVHAKHTVSARFLENAFVTAGENISVRDRIGHSEVEAGEEVLVGEEGGKGQIIGGMTRARRGVRAKSLGSAASVNTLVEVGFTHDLKERIAEIDEQLEAQQSRVAQVKAAFQRLRDNPQALPEATIHKLEKAESQLRAEVQGLVQAKSELEERIKEAEQASITAAREAYTNVTAVIAGAHYRVGEDRRSTAFVLEEGEVVCR
jgi:uncharacterized protein (DUF342 family)